MQVKKLNPEYLADLQKAIGSFPKVIEDTYARVKSALERERPQEGTDAALEAYFRQRLHDESQAAAQFRSAVEQITTLNPENLAKDAGYRLQVADDVALLREKPSASAMRAAERSPIDIGSIPAFKRRIAEEEPQLIRANGDPRDSDVAKAIYPEIHSNGDIRRGLSALAEECQALDHTDAAPGRISESIRLTRLNARKLLSGQNRG